MDGISQLVYQRDACLNDYGIVSNDLCSFSQNNPQIGSVWTTLSNIKVLNDSVSEEEEKVDFDSISFKLFG
jgi:hypothetical protein